MNEYLEKQYQDLQDQMKNAIGRFVSTDEIQNNGKIILKSLVQDECLTHGVSVPNSMCVTNTDVKNSVNCFGLLNDAAVSISGFGALADMFNNDISDKDKIECLLGMSHAYGFVQGVLAFRLKAKIAGGVGAQARAEKESKKGKLVIEYMLKIDGNKLESADTLASDILGKPGVYKSHRKIADTIRQYRKNVTCGANDAINDA